MTVVPSDAVVEHDKLDAWAAIAIIITVVLRTIVRFMP
jgi:hypothetical protein